MDLDRLRELSHLQREIEILADLRDSLYYPVRSPRISGEPHGTTPGDPTVNAVHAIEDVNRKIYELQNRLAEEVSEVLDWIYNELEQSELRSIIICHYLQGMTWEQTTRHVLGYYGTDSARMRVYRYFGRCNEM